MPGLYVGALLSALGIFSLPNSFMPCFLSTAGPLSLPLPVSFTFFCLLTFHFCNPLLNLFLSDLSCASPPSVLHAAFVATFVQPILLDAQRGPYPAEIARCLTTAQNHIEAVESFPQIMLEVITRSESGKL